MSLFPSTSRQTAILNDNEALIAVQACEMVRKTRKNKRTAHFKLAAPQTPRKPLERKASKQSPAKPLVIKQKGENLVHGDSCKRKLPDGLAQTVMKKPRIRLVEKPIKISKAPEVKNDEEVKVKVEEEEFDLEEAVLKGFMEDETGVKVEEEEGFDFEAEVMQGMMDDG